MLVDKFLVDHLIKRWGNGIDRDRVVTEAKDTVKSNTVEFSTAK